MTGENIGELAEHLEAFSMREVCERLQLEESFIVECIDLGITEAEGPVHGVPLQQWRLSIDSVLRIKKARRLQRDLQIGLSDLPLVLDLLDEVETLRHEVDFLRKRLSHWEPAD